MTDEITSDSMIGDSNHRLMKLVVHWICLCWKLNIMILEGSDYPGYQVLLLESRLGSLLQEAWRIIAETVFLTSKITHSVTASRLHLSPIPQTSYQHFTNMRQQMLSVLLHFYFFFAQVTSQQSMLF